MQGRLIKHRSGCTLISLPHTNPGALLHGRLFPLGVGEAHYWLNKYRVRLETLVTFITLNSFGNFQRKLRPVFCACVLVKNAAGVFAQKKKRFNLQTLCEINVQIYAQMFPNDLLPTFHHSSLESSVTWTRSPGLKQTKHIEEEVLKNKWVKEEGGDEKRRNTKDNII